MTAARVSETGETISSFRASGQAVRARELRERASTGTAPCSLLTWLTASASRCRSVRSSRSAALAGGMRQAAGNARPLCAARPCHVVSPESRQQGGAGRESGRGRARSPRPSRELASVATARPRLLASLRHALALERASRRRGLALSLAHESQRRASRRKLTTDVILGSRRPAALEPPRPLCAHRRLGVDPVASSSSDLPATCRRLASASISPPMSSRHDVTAAGPLRCVPVQARNAVAARASSERAASEQRASSELDAQHVRTSTRGAAQQQRRYRAVMTSRRQASPQRRVPMQRCNAATLSQREPSRARASSRRHKRRSARTRARDVKPLDVAAAGRPARAHPTPQ